MIRKIIMVIIVLVVFILPPKDGGVMAQTETPEPPTPTPTEWDIPIYNTPVVNTPGINPGEICPLATRDPAKILDINWAVECADCITVTPYGTPLPTTQINTPQPTIMSTNELGTPIAVTQTPEAQQTITPTETPSRMYVYISSLLWDGDPYAYNSGLENLLGEPDGIYTEIWRTQDPGQARFLLSFPVGVGGKAGDRITMPFENAMAGTNGIMFFSDALGHQLGAACYPDLLTGYYHVNGDGKQYCQATQDYTHVFVQMRVYNTNAHVKFDYAKLETDYIEPTPIPPLVGYCSEWQYTDEEINIGEPVAIFTGLKVGSGGCHTVLPGKQLNLPNEEGSIGWPSVEFCIQKVEIPYIEFMGVQLPISMLAIPAIGMIIKMIMSI